jgi:hypothetical protein
VVRVVHRKPAIWRACALARALLNRSAMFSISRLTVALALAAPAILGLLLLGGCLDPGSLTVVDGVSRYRDSDAFVHMSARPYDSDISKDTRIDVWVSKDAADEYARITPEGHGSGADLPYGTVIVREVRDRKTDQVLKLTLMVKGPVGVDPELGDWWYAVTDPVGVPLVDDEGNEKRGNLPECMGCHEDRGDEDDFLFGVPRDVRR